SGRITDLLQASPERPGVFHAIEKRFRTGVTDSLGRSVREAMEIVLGQKLPNAQVHTAGMLILEGPGLTDEMLAKVAREVYCNELIESWTLMQESELGSHSRFQRETSRRMTPKSFYGSPDPVERTDITSQTPEELVAWGKK